MDGIRKKIVHDIAPDSHARKHEPLHKNPYEKDIERVAAMFDSSPLVFHEDPSRGETRAGGSAKGFRRFLYKDFFQFRNIVSKFPRYQKISPMYWGLGGGVGIILLLVLVLSTVFAHVTITIKPKVEQLALEGVTVAFDSSISQTIAGKRMIPAERVDFSKNLEKKFESTGRQFVEEKARGTVKIYNSFGSAPQLLVSGTRFTTDNGLLYRLAKSVSVPAAKIENGKIVPQFIQAEVAADKAGDGYNKDGTSRLHIPGFQGTPKFEGFYADAEQGFSGGFRGDARVVSQDDLTSAQNATTKELYDSLTREMAGKIPPDFTFIDRFRDIQIIKIDLPKQGTRLDQFAIQVQARARALIFRESDVVGLLGQLLVKPDTQEIVKTGYDIRYQLVSMDLDKGRADVLLNGSVKAKSLVSDSGLVDLVKGKKQGSVVEALKGRGEITDFQVKFFPPWLISTPQDASKIEVVRENQK